jgi:hypothetical protein
MSSLFNLRRNQHLLVTTIANSLVAASLIMTIYVLAEGWLW